MHPEDQKEGSTAVRKRCNCGKNPSTGGNGGDAEAFSSYPLPTRLCLALPPFRSRLLNDAMRGPPVFITASRYPLKGPVPLINTQTNVFLLDVAFSSTPGLTALNDFTVLYKLKRKQKIYQCHIPLTYLGCVCERARASPRQSYNLVLFAFGTILIIHSLIDHYTGSASNCGESLYPCPPSERDWWSRYR
ncbi:hypothetical protein L228DRAFT_151203 [Xylona heveae TC161]|uniref:Uncharacterized protein n=1 Tax=Xylona heveae (strain CBS 132557 / TC161) TaxID=1328760 RepID=A0A165GM72_XYLHT|nr:hypothetical protein L228DRAFT_151203 [Xylona heveae TC161]KZF22362.1 hypothetical protein L228DRAFT_151203 [Xylona heveae TC161]